MILKTCSDSHTWTQGSFDLAPYIGQTIRLFFNVHENGNGLPTSMYVDDVTVNAS